MAATGQAQGGDGQGQGQQQAAEGQQQQAGPDIGQLAQQLGQLSQGQEDLRQFLQTAPWQQQDPGQAQDQQQQGQQEPAINVDLSFLDDPTLDPAQTSERLTGVVGQLVQQGVQEGLQQHLSPMQEQIAEQRREGQMERLVSEFPEMGQIETATEVVKLSRQYAEMLGNPALGEEPAFWRIMYAAGRAFDQAGQEGQGSGDPGAATLEGGGGATPGGGQQGDRFDAALNVKRGSGALPFG